MNNEATGALIRTLRKEKKLTQKELAGRLHVTESAVSKWERGLSYPDITLLHDICAVLGVTIMNITEGYNYLESIICALGAGIGFLLAMVLFAGLRERLENCKGIPQCWQGIPITLVTAAILSMAFMAFSGVVDGIFG